MTYPNLPDDAALAKALRNLFISEVERAALQPAKALVPLRGNVRANAPSWSLLGVAAAVCVLAVAVVSAQLGHGLPSISGSKNGTSGAVSSATETPSSPASSGPVFGRFVGGIPATIDGQPVLLASAAAKAFQSSSDDKSILVGGWYYSAGSFCPALRPGEGPWSTCLGYHVLSRPVPGSPEIVVVPGASGISVGNVAQGSVAPVVLRVHTHDASCPSSGRLDCAHLAVLDEVVWKGSGESMPDPSSTRPPSGISEQDVTAMAEHFASQYSSLSARAVSAVDGPYLTVAPPGADIPADRWVWAVVVAGSFPAPDCGSSAPSATCLPDVKTQLVVLDYETGSVLLAEAPAP